MRKLPGADPRPVDVFECSMPAKDGLAAQIPELSEPIPRRTCSSDRQRFWNRKGRRFTCCLFDEPIPVVCHAD